MPGLCEGGSKTLNIDVPDNDLPIIAAGIGSAAPEDQEQRAAEQQEVEERLAQQPLQHGLSSALWRVPDRRGIGPLLRRHRP